MLVVDLNNVGYIEVKLVVKLNNVLSGRSCKIEGIYKIWRCRRSWEKCMRGEVRISYEREVVKKL